MSGGGGGGIPIIKDIPILKDLIPGAKGGNDQAMGGSSPGVGDPDLARKQRDLLRSRLSGDESIDDVARTDLMAQLDVANSDPVLIQQKYDELLDPETTSGRDLLYRRERKKISERPGLKSQTSFFSPEPVAGDRGGGFFT